VKNKAHLVARGNYQRPGIDKWRVVLAGNAARIASHASGHSRLPRLRYYPVQRHVGALPRDAQGGPVHGTARWLRCAGYGEMGLETQERAVWTSAGRENVERGAERPYMGWSVPRYGEGLAVYLKNSWDQADFAAGGFWVDEFRWNRV